MRIDIENIMDLPVGIIDDFYSNEECKKIWQELNFLNNSKTKLLPPEMTSSAYDIDKEGNKVFLKKNKGIFLDYVYGQHRHFSDILTINRKIFSEEIRKQLMENHVFFRYLDNCNKDLTLLQYYDTSDEYKFHYDKCTITFITFFHEIPKKFIGGDFVFENDLVVESKNNRSIIFPSILKHKVTETIVKETKTDKNYGRYSISQLMHII